MSEQDTLPDGRIDHRTHQREPDNHWGFLCVDCSTEERDVAWTIPHGVDGSPILDSWRDAPPSWVRRACGLPEQDPDVIIAAIREVHARYFDLDGKPGTDDTNPEPEDVWRFDRDIRKAFNGLCSETWNCEFPIGHRGQNPCGQRLPTTPADLPPDVARSRVPGGGGGAL